MTQRIGRRFLKPEKKNLKLVDSGSGFVYLSVTLTIEWESVSLFSSFSEHIRLRLTKGSSEIIGWVRWRESKRKIPTFIVIQDSEPEPPGLNVPLLTAFLEALYDLQDRLRNVETMYSE